jgi:hypothetical protein
VCRLASRLRCRPHRLDPFWQPRSSSFIHLLALQWFAIGFALFGRPVLVRFRRWRHLFRWSILLCRSILLCHWSAGFRIRLHVLRSGCPPPSSNIAAVVDNSRRFLRDVSFGGPRPLGRLNVVVWMYQRQRRPPRSFQIVVDSKLLSRIAQLNRRYSNCRRAVR